MNYIGKPFSHFNLVTRCCTRVNTREVQQSRYLNHDRVKVWVHITGHQLKAHIPETFQQEITQTLLWRLTLCVCVTGLRESLNRQVLYLILPYLAKIENYHYLWINPFSTDPLSLSILRGFFLFVNIP